MSAQESKLLIMYYHSLRLYVLVVDLDLDVERHVDGVTRAKASETKRGSGLGLKVDRHLFI